MRKVFIGFLFVLLIGICVADLVFVGNTIKYTMNQSIELEEEIEKNALSGEAGTLIKKMYDDWIKKENYLSVFVYHAEIKVIGEKIAYIKALIKEKEETQVKIEVANLKYLLESFEETFAFNLSNIF